MAAKKTTKTIEEKGTKEQQKKRKALSVKRKATSTKVTKEKAPKVTKKTENVEAILAVKAEKAEEKKAVSKSLTVYVYGVNGKEIEKIDLPKEIFGVKVNKILLAQAVRVYLANQRQGNASTKTRGEVTGSTRKIYRQKGTGRARHGGVRAPIFVHGGIAHGPKPKDHTLILPKKMKRAALFSALTAKLIDGNMKIVSGIENIEPKTRIMAQSLKNFGLIEKKPKVLLVTPDNNEVVLRAGRNLAGVTITAAERLNTYEVLNAKNLVLMKESIARLQEVFLNKK